MIFPWAPSRSRNANSGAAGYGAMELFIVGKGKLTLGQREFVGQGGEGAVYARDDRAYKIYSDPAKMIPLAKIRELSALSLPTMIRPEEVLLDARNRPVGYGMRRVRDAHVLCQAFNRAFRDRHGLTPDRMLALVRELQSGVQHVHAHDCLIVDLNEMNFLLDAAFREVLFIDVDSYQTPGFPATALMDSIRDRHADRFSRETDWFSFAVISFQMLVGIHPYKGKHPTLTTLDARMLENVSVFNPQVAVPKVCYPFDVIPQVYRDWYQAVFERGLRLPPPTAPHAVINMASQVRTVTGGDRLRLWEVAQFPAGVVLPILLLGTDAAVTTEGVYLRGRRHLLGSDFRVALTPRMAHLIAGRVVDGTLELYDLSQGAHLLDRLRAEALSVCEGRFTVKQGDGLWEVEFLELPGGVRAALRRVGNAMEQATHLFDGVALQNMLGVWYASLFSGPGACHTVRLPQLDGCRIVDARFERGVLMVIAAQEGRYDRHLFRFDTSYGSCDERVDRDVSYTGLNFVVLDSGVCVHLNEQEDLEVFSSRKGSSTLQVITDPGVAGGRLFKQGTQVFLARDDTLYSLGMR